MPELQIAVRCVGDANYEIKNCLHQFDQGMETIRFDQAGTEGTMSVGIRYFFTKGPELQPYVYRGTTLILQLNSDEIVSAGDMLGALERHGGGPLVDVSSVVAHMGLWIRVGERKAVAEFIHREANRRVEWIEPDGHQGENRKKTTVDLEFQLEFPAEDDHVFEGDVVEFPDGLAHPENFHAVFGGVEFYGILHIPNI